MHRIFENPIGQYAGYGVVSGTSMIMLAAHDAAIKIDPTGILSIIPSWAVTTGWVISTIALTISTLAGAYKRTMEGRAAVIQAEKDICTEGDCPYRQHWIETRKSKNGGQK
jgi:hypothetical protein